MNKRLLVAVANIILVVSAAGSVGAAAAELKVMCANAMKSAVKQLVPMWSS